MQDAKFNRVAANNSITPTISFLHIPFSNQWFANQYKDSPLFKIN